MFEKAVRMRKVEGSSSCWRTLRLRRGFVLIDDWIDRPELVERLDLFAFFTPR